ncbi:hypothetical protein BRD01_02935 [Halobacteriales archaeon QS_8_65_32]|nr:MAG: hypothetical protein BRD01_02935 [Halobacteriales archaeon QS_8_65_32]
MKRANDGRRYPMGVDECSRCGATAFVPLDAAGSETGRPPSVVFAESRTVPAWWCRTGRSQ